MPQLLQCGVTVSWFAYLSLLVIIEARTERCINKHGSLLYVYEHSQNVAIRHGSMYCRPIATAEPSLLIACSPGL